MSIRIQGSSISIAYENINGPVLRNTDMLANPLGFIFSPNNQWLELSKLPTSKIPGMLIIPILLATIPSLSFYYGTTQIGWTVLGGDPIKLSSISAMKISVAFYVVILGSLAVVGAAIHWMSETYPSEDSQALEGSNLIRSIAIAAFTATPLFVASIFGFYPIIWFDLLLGVAAASWSVYLLYTGIPIVMGLPKEQGFLYASAVVIVCLVLISAIMAGAVILGDMGLSLVFTD